jgi:hypothetical protein
MRRKNPNMSGGDGSEAMVLDEGKQREIERGEEEHSGQTPGVKNDGVDENFEGERGEEPGERFHGSGKRRAEARRLIFSSEQPRGHYKRKDRL